MIGIVPEVVFEICLAALGLYLLTAVHEIGHLAAGYLLDRPILKMVVGKGPQLYRCVFRGIVCEFRLVPLEGRVSFAIASSRPWKNILILLAGPGAELLVVLAAYGLGYYWLAAIGMGLALGELIPCRRGGSPSDGWQILAWTARWIINRRSA